MLSSTESKELLSGQGREVGKAGEGGEEGEGGVRGRRDAPLGECG